MTKHELALHLSDPATPAIDLVVGMIVTKAVNEGDERRMGFLLDRLIGKVKEEIEHSFLKPTIIIRPNGDRVIMGAVEEDEK